MKIHWCPAGEAIPLDAIGDDAVCVVVPENDAVHAQLRVLLQALSIYAERNVEYNDNWKRMGSRGMLVRVRERAERLWDALWDSPSDYACEQPKVLDDALDLINFAGFLIRAAREGNRDGTWWGRQPSEVQIVVDAGLFDPVEFARLQDLIGKPVRVTRVQGQQAIIEEA